MRHDQPCPVCRHPGVCHRPHPGAAPCLGLAPAGAGRHAPRPNVAGGARRGRLGEEGKKKGAATTLPTALGLLQADGRIRRVPVNGRLDQQRYAYTPWGLPPSRLGPEGAREELIRRYLGWTGGATIRQSQWFTGFTVTDSKAALAAVGAVEVPTAAGDVLWMLPADVELLADFSPPEGEQIQLLAGT